jgi:ABC-2 type transport system ATP-binding protein
LRRLRGRAHGQGQLHLQIIGIYPARDLQLGGAQQARIHDRSSAGSAGKVSCRPTSNGIAFVDTFAFSNGFARGCDDALRDAAVSVLITLFAGAGTMTSSPKTSSPKTWAPDIAIDVKGLTKTFDGRAVVRDLSMQVRRGTIYGFLGPNGSGKTTTIRMLTGLLTPDQGEGTCLGFNIRTQAHEIKRHVGYMTQRFSLYQDLSVRENLEFVARLYGIANPVGAAREMVKRLGLGGREAQLDGELSGGWKQRLALGACTLPNPQLLLLDEPTAGVDPKARREFWNEIHALAAQGLTVLVSTHYMDEAERCHEIAYIAYGVLLVHGTVEQVIAASHLTTYTVGDRNGEGLAGLAEELGRTQGVDMVAPFGTSLHVSGRDEAALEAALAPFHERPELVWTRSQASLEDVFIDLLAKAQDNFADNLAG